MKVITLKDAAEVLRALNKGYITSEQKTPILMEIVKGKTYDIYVPDDAVNINTPPPVTYQSPPPVTPPPLKVDDHTPSILDDYLKLIIARETQGATNIQPPQQDNTMMWIAIALGGLFLLSKK